MIENYFSASKALARLRAGISGPHIDDFAGALEKQGYAHSTAIRYLRAAAKDAPWQMWIGACWMRLSDTFNIVAALIPTMKGLAFTQAAE